MTGTTAAPRAAVVAMLVGLFLLIARPVLVRATPAPVAVLVAVFVALLTAGALWPLAAAPAASAAPAATGRVHWGIVLALGAAAFVVGRLIGGGHPPHAAVARLLVLDGLAAVAEELFFRRFVYGLLAPAGAAWAVAGSALLFAVVHVTVYGTWVLAIDLAAGLVLSWQRYATGSWRVPALTHVLANVLVVL